MDVGFVNWAGPGLPSGPAKIIFGTVTAPPGTSLATFQNRVTPSLRLFVVSGYSAAPAGLLFRGHVTHLTAWF
jgi:hypothetical protein